MRKVDYTKLNSRQQEIFNFQKVAAVLAEYGFNCIQLRDDWQGADFLAYHMEGKNTLKVQLKGRLTIDKKYKGKKLYVAFPIEGHWYLIEHDELINKVKLYTDWLDSRSWKENGSYHSAKPPVKLIQQLADQKL